MKSIKESKELVAGIQLLGVTAKKVMADGKLSKEDLPLALELITNANVLIEAVQGLGELKEEIKDVDQAELIELGAAVYGAIKAIKEAK